MGQHAAVSCEVVFSDCRIPQENMLGPINSGFRIALQELAGGRIGIGSLALGVGLAAMEYSTRYALDRVQFGRKISEFQAIRWMIADHHTELEAARLLLLNAAFQKERGRKFAREASMAKLYATEAANRACYSALQILGGYGYSKEYPLERHARDARVTTLYEGTSEIQRMVIARDILQSFST
jgi:alkylation response protein AidB-like acyl-CoA dehydrogenase